MTPPKPPETRPYHHGDLRRALIEAARRMLKTEGAAALSLRGVAREAGVSPAAPYHHFKDKSELLQAVANEGWHELSQSLAEAETWKGAAGDKVSPLLLAYVQFARGEPALYWIMYESARDSEDLPRQARSGEATAYMRLRTALAEQGAQLTETEMELTMTAAWCAAHGLASMAGFRQFDHLKSELGGEVEFLQAVLDRLGIYQKALEH